LEIFKFKFGSVVYEVRILHLESTTQVLIAKYWWLTQAGRNRALRKQAMIQTLTCSSTLSCASAPIH